MVGYFNLQLNTPRLHLNMYNATPCLSNPYSFGTLVTPQFIPMNFGCNTIPWIGDLFSTNQTMGSLNILYNSNAWINQARAGMTYCNMMPGAFSQYYPIPSLQDTINAFMRDNAGLQMPTLNFTNPWRPVTPGSSTTSGNVADAVAQETFNELYSFMTKFIDNIYSGNTKTTYKTEINNIKNSSDTITEKLKKLKDKFKTIAKAENLYNYLKNKEDVSININSENGSIAYWLTECGLIPTDAIKTATNTLKDKLKNISDANTSIASETDLQNAGILEFISAYNDTGADIINDFKTAYNKIKDNNSKNDFKNTFVNKIVQPLINEADKYKDNNALDDSTKTEIKQACNALSNVSDKTPNNVEGSFNKLYVLLRLASATVINVELTNSFGAFGDVFKFDNNDTNTVAGKIYNETIEDLKSEELTSLVSSLKGKVNGKPEEVVTTEVEEVVEEPKANLPETGTTVTAETMTTYCNRGYLKQLSGAKVSVTTTEGDTETKTEYQVYKVEKTNPTEYVALVGDKIKEVKKDAEGNYSLSENEITTGSMNKRCKLMENINTDHVITCTKTTDNETTDEFESDTYTMDIPENVFDKAPEYTMKSYELYENNTKTEYETIKKKHETLKTASDALNELINEYGENISYDSDKKVFTYNGKNYALFTDGKIYEVKSEENGSYEKQGTNAAMTIEKLENGLKEANELKTKMDELANASENDELKYDENDKVYTYENRTFQIINGKVFEVTKGENGKYVKKNSQDAGMTDTQFNEMIAKDIIENLVTNCGQCEFGGKTNYTKYINGINSHNIVTIIKYLKDNPVIIIDRPYYLLGVIDRHNIYNKTENTYIKETINKLITVVEMHPNYNKYSGEFTEIITKLKKEKGFLKTAGDLDKLTFKLIEKYEQLDKMG